MAEARSTRQRAAVWNALERADGFLSAQEVFDAVRGTGERVGLATVYRRLQALVDGGDVDVLRGEDGEALYRACRTSEHHHHLICRNCGASVEIKSTAIERWAAESARKHGFTDVTHTAELYGRCRRCS
ncbi:MAG TPA: Fur family transcriptional regulator [Actinomycetota bacterium]|nr:Fur family transcriptional regulator [Actinomycetota bacterium]